METEVTRKEGGTKDLGLCLERFLFISKFLRNLILNSIKFVFSMIFGLAWRKALGFSGLQKTVRSLFQKQSAWNGGPVCNINPIWSRRPVPVSF